MSDEEQPKTKEERELRGLFLELRGLEETRAPDFGHTWAAAIRARPKRFVGLALLGVGATALAGVVVVGLLFQPAAPTTEVASIDWSDRESLGFLLKSSHVVSPKRIDFDADPYDLRLAEVLENADRGASR